MLMWVVWSTKMESIPGEVEKKMRIFSRHVH
jgi:hypothetical protein